MKEQQARNKQCAAGNQRRARRGGRSRTWIKRNFSPEAKARAAKMVDNLVSALRDRINGLDWMSSATKVQAVAKLERVPAESRVPRQVARLLDARPSSPARTTRTSKPSPSGTRRAPGRGWGRRRIAREWSMTPPTVNASYSSSLNQIQFPAGILQPPFFDPNADDAVNYGALGAVIGHEMTHGFDDSGRQFDAQGNLRDWWTPEDAAKYKAAAQLVVDQFNGYTVVDSVSHVNGRLTLGENIADLGGLTVAYYAMEKAIAGKPHAKIDGFTPEQRFFLAWAQIWRGLSRPSRRCRIRSRPKPHSPGKWRVERAVVEHARVQGGVGLQGRRSDGAARQPAREDLVEAPRKRAQDRRRGEAVSVSPRCVRASTAYAVAASLMNLPMSVFGSRCLLSDDAVHAPVARSWCSTSQPIARETRASVAPTPARCSA